MRSAVAALAVMMVLWVPAHGDVEVRIVDAPSKVIRYSPVFVTARLTNTGRNAALVPATRHGESHYFLETGRTGSTPTERRDFTGSGGGGAVWLAPGESFWFRADVGRWLDDVGRHVIRAGVVSTGACQMLVGGSGMSPAKRVSHAPGMDLYECWSGRATSKTVQVDVVEATSAEDLAALDYIKGEALPEDRENGEWIRLRLGYRISELLDRFPTSNYAYVGALYGCTASPDCLRRVLERRSGMGLESTARVQWWLASLRAGRELEASTVASMEVPSKLKAFLAQEERRIRSSHRD